MNSELKLFNNGSAAVLKWSKLDAQHVQKSGHTRDTKLKGYTHSFNSKSSASFFIHLLKPLASLKQVRQLRSCTDLNLCAS